MGKFAGGPMGSQAASQAWQTLAAKLNSLGDGVQKSWEQWRRYWVEIKNRTKNKGADSRRLMRGTGGGPNRLEPLTPLEERILALIGNVAVDGLPGVRVPIDESSQNYNSPSILEHFPVISEVTPINVASESTEMQNIDGCIIEENMEIVELQAPLPSDFVLDNQPVVLEFEHQDTQSTHITERQGLPSTHISEQQGTPSTHITEQQGTPSTHITEQQGTPSTHITEQQGTPSTHITERQGLPSTHISEQQGTPSTHITEQQGTPSTHITEQQGTPSTHITGQQAQRTQAQQSTSSRRTQPRRRRLQNMRNSQDDLKMKSA